jgi:hypothetical protein
MPIKDPIKRKEYWKKYQENNREYIREYQRRWYSENKDWLRVQTKWRRIRQRKEREAKKLSLNNI